MHLFITGAFPKDDRFFSILEQMGHEVTFLQDEKSSLTDAEAARMEGIICNGFFLHHAIEQFPNLKYIQLTSAGYDRVPMDYIRAHGICIFNARGVYSGPIAEFVLSGVLQLYKKMSAFTDSQRNHRWEKRRDVLELAGKTVCIVGCGSVGTECAKRFTAFGCTVYGVDLYPTENSAFTVMYPLEKLNDVLAGADVTVLTLPLTNETYHMFNAARLAYLKDGAAFANVARGAIVDEKALADTLPRLYGAVLDVFETEPLPPDSPLWDMENVIVTPHNSFVGENNTKRMQAVILENLRTI